MPDEKKIQEQARKLLEEFSEELKGVPETEETHYVVDLKNVTRPDSPGKCDPAFHGKLEKLVPIWDYGYVRVVKKK